MELWRACRLVVDTGLHHHQWTRQEAVDYLMENTPNPEGDAINAIDRYIVYPGQATAYKIGMLEILRLRGIAEPKRQVLMIPARVKGLVCLVSFRSSGQATRCGQL